LYNWKFLKDERSKPQQQQQYSGLKLAMQLCVPSRCDVKVVAQKNKK